MRLLALTVCSQAVGGSLTYCLRFQWSSCTAPAHSQEMSGTWPGGDIHWWTSPETFQLPRSPSLGIRFARCASESHRRNSLVCSWWFAPALWSERIDTENLIFPSVRPSSFMISVLINNNNKANLLYVANTSEEWPDMLKKIQVSVVGVYRAEKL